MIDNFKCALDNINNPNYEPVISLNDDVHDFLKWDLYMLSFIENPHYVSFAELIPIIKASPKCKKHIKGIVYLTNDEKEYLQLL